MDHTVTMTDIQCNRGEDIQSDGPETDGGITRARTRTAVFRPLGRVRARPEMEGHERGVALSHVLHLEPIATQ